MNTSKTPEDFDNLLDTVEESIEYAFEAGLEQLKEDATEAFDEAVEKAGEDPVFFALILEPVLETVSEYFETARADFEVSVDRVNLGIDTRAIELQNEYIRKQRKC